MFQRIRQYELIQRGHQTYRPRSYSNQQPDGTWEGWLVFFPLSGHPAIATNRETTQASYDDLVDWADGLGRVYLNGALDRALTLEAQPPALAELAAAEYEALDEAALLDAEADAEREMAADARADAEALHETRLETEEAIAAADETQAELEVAAHERGAENARAASAAAGQRRLRAQKERSLPRSGRSSRRAK